MENQLIDNQTILYTMGMGFVLKITVFVLGFLTVRMGYRLIREGVTGSFTFSSEAKGFKGALQSSSPGLLFVLLGVVLIGYAIYLNKGVTIDARVDGSAHETKTRLLQGGRPSLPPTDSTQNEGNVSE